MNIPRNEAILNQTLASQASSYAPLLTDIGAAFVFGLGFYFFKKHFSGFTNSKPQNDAEEYQPSEKPQKDAYKPIRDKIDYTISNWESEISLQKINSIIKKELDESNFDPFGILDQLHKNNVNPDVSTMNTLLDTCTKLNDFKNFNRLCELIIDAENYLNSNMPAANIVTFNIILKGLNNDMCKLDFEERSKFLAPAKVEFLLKEILSRNLQPNDITLNTVIDMLVESGNFGLAWKYYEEMEKEYLIEPDIFTYSTLLKSIKNYQPDDENIEKAFEILKIVKLSQAKGVKPDEIFYNCILETCVKYGKMEAAEVVFNDMRENALITPSKITFSIMIKGFGNASNLEKCFILFHEMKQYCLEPNEIIYGCILNACVKANNLFKAVEVFNEIQNNCSGVCMNVYIYTILIKGYTKTKDFAKAFELYNQMLQDTSITLNIIVFNAILDCCVECFDIDMMKKIYEDLRQRAVLDESYPQPDLITYSTVIKGYAKVRDSSKVLDIYYYLCGRDDLQLDEIIYCSVLDAMLKTDRMNEALSIYEQMKKAQIHKTNASYSILIKIFSKLNDVEKAVDIYNDMISEKIQPSLITYTAIIQFLIKTKRVLNAIQIFEEILQNKIKPDQVLFNVIINGCVLNGRLDEGCKFLLEAFKNEIRVCDDVYYNVLNNLLTNRTMDPLYKNELTYKICQEMTFRGLEIDSELYNKIVRMLNRKYSKNPVNNNNNNNNYNKYNEEYSVYNNQSNYEQSYYEHYNNNNGRYADYNNKYNGNNYNNSRKYNDGCNQTVLGEDQSIYDFVEKRISTNPNLRDRNENKYGDVNTTTNNFYEERSNYDKNTSYYPKNNINKSNKNINYNKSYYNQSVYGNKGNKNHKETEYEFNN